MTVGGHDPATLWALELARSERRWRHEVSPDRDAISPLVGATDPLHVALDIEAAAVREEAGTDVRVEWKLPAPLGPGLSLAVLRVVQELLAATAKEAELVVIRVSVEGDDILVEVTAVDSDGTPVAVTLPRIAGGGIETIQGRVRLGQAVSSVTSTITRASSRPSD
jgi:signal transduction histidine kinase